MRKKNEKGNPIETTVEKEMSFLDHIEELRWHLIRSIIVLILIGIIVFLLKDLVISTLFAPRYNSFPTHKLLCSFLNVNCDVPQFQIIQRNLGEEFFVHLTSSLWLALILSFPYLFWEIWRFIKPGLHNHEIKATRGIVMICSILFFLGVLFGYYVIFPMSISFLAGYSFGLDNESTATLSSYVSYITAITLPTGIVFQFPVFVYFFGKVGLLSSQLLKKFRRHGIVVVFIIAAIITPPDVASQLLMAFPMLTLYEVSIYILKRIEKKNKITNEKDQLSHGK